MRSKNEIEIDFHFLKLRLYSRTRQRVNKKIYADQRRERQGCRTSELHSAKLKLILAFINDKERTHDGLPAPQALPAPRSFSGGRMMRWRNALSFFGVCLEAWWPSCRSVCLHQRTPRKLE